MPFTACRLSRVIRFGKVVEPVADGQKVLATKLMLLKTLDKMNHMLKLIFRSDLLC